MFADGPEEVRFRPIGVVRSPFSDLDGMPLQSVAAAGRQTCSHGTPVLDIKPYVPAFDVVDADRTGWLAHGAPRVHEIRSDWR